MSESIWKKELSFRRKPRQETLRVVEAAPPVVEAASPVLEAAPPVVDATPLPIDPMVQAVQQLAVATDQTSTQAAAVAVDALLQFLVVAAPEQVEQSAVEPVAVQPEPVEPAPVEPQVVQPEVALAEPALIPSADPVLAEPAPPEPPAPEVVPPPVEAPVEQTPAPVAAAPEPQPVAHVDPEPAVEEPQGGHVVELWPSDTVVDEAAWMRSDIDDALMPRSLSLEQQLEFMHEQTDPVAPTLAPNPVTELQPPAVEESPLPVVPEPVVVAPPAPEPPATPVVPDPAVVAPQAAVPASVVPEPIVAAPAPEPAPPAPLAAGPVVEPAVQSAPTRPVVSQPVVVQQLPPVAQAPTAAPVIPPQPIAAPVTVAPEPAQAQPAPAAAPPVPFWKREIGRGGKNQKKQKAQKQKKQTPASTESTPAQPSVPFWKKELSFGKKKSDTKSPQAKSAKPKTPLLKRQVKLGLPKIDLGSLANRKVGKSEYTTDLDKLVGLRIGSSQLAAALVHNNGSAELMKIARSPLRPGLVTAGEVHDVNGLASALKSFFSQHKLPRRGVRIGVATNRIGVRVMEIPALDDPKAAANAVRFRAQEVLPFPLTEAVVDHVDLGEGPNDTRRVLIAFAHRGLIDQYVDACKRAKLKLAGIDFDAFALLRAVTAKRDADEAWTAALVALAIGHDRTIFAVSDGHVCEFTRVLDWGGSAIDTALAEALDVTPDVAEKLKLELSLSGEPEHPNLAPEGVELARKAIRESLQLLARELVASLQFYQSRPGSLAIGELLITGGGAGLAGLDAELTRMLGVPVQIADPFAGVDVGAGVSVPVDDSGSLAIAIGLAIEDQH
jgi:type IV pilus assembly protein PilM